MSEQEQVLAYLGLYRRFGDVKSRLEDALRTADRLARLLLEARGAPQEEVDGILAGWPGSDDMVRAVSRYREARAALYDAWEVMTAEVRTGLRSPEGL